MNKVSSLVADGKRAFISHPFFSYLNNESVSIEHRLRFLPNIAHFVMSFSDINKYILPFSQPQNALEEAVNTHAKEDAEHWPWFLTDLRNTGANEAKDFTEHLAFLWSDKLKNSRKLTYKLIQYLTDQPAKMRLVVIEVMEATGNATFDTLARITLNTTLSLEYCGNIHLSHETGHSIGSDDELIDTIAFSDKENKEARELIHNCFTAFEEFFDELLQNALIKENS